MCCYILHECLLLGNYQFLQTTIPSPLRDCQLHQNPSPTVFYFPISSILETKHRLQYKLYSYIYNYFFKLKKNFY